MAPGRWAALSTQDLKSGIRVPFTDSARERLQRQSRAQGRETERGIVEEKQAGRKKHALIDTHATEIYLSRAAAS